MRAAVSVSVVVCGVKKNKTGEGTASDKVAAIPDGGQERAPRKVTLGQWPKWSES